MIVEPARAGALRVNTDLAGGALITAVAAVALIYARDATFNVWIFPRITAAGLAALGVGLVVKGLIAPERQQVFSGWSQAFRVLPFALGLVVYAVLFSRAGFIATTIVAYSAATWVLRRHFTLRSAAISLAIGAVFTLLLHALFSRVFYVPLPQGSWWTGG